ncbi:MAG: glycine oxidase ThiO [Deltaproteobacteria bacterium]|nr:glycine oxidase ThiO [Deltaproteobacteria bacterium]
MTRTADVVVIGGGVIGSAIAWNLAAQQQHTILVEKNQPGKEASSAAAGILAVASGRSKRGPMYQLKSASQKLYPALVQELEERTGIDIEYQRVGVLDLIRNDADEKKYRQLYDLRREQGYSATWLSAEEARRFEPELTTDIRGAVHFSDDHHLNNERLAEAWAKAAAQRGATVQTGVTVNEARMTNGKVTAVRIGEEWVNTNTVVIAAGSWSQEVGTIFGLTIPTQPAKGQMLTVRFPRVRHVISWNDHYLVPRKNGEVVIGSTVEFVGHNKEVTLETVRSLIDRSVELVPTVRTAPLNRFWAGLRPYSPTRRPILDRAPGLENVILATGHHRNGIVLAPITGQLICELITTGKTSMSLEPFAFPREPVPPASADESPDEAD